jgi:hypothetical protein
MDFVAFHVILLLTVGYFDGTTGFALRHAVPVGIVLCALSAPFFTHRILPEVIVCSESS